MLHRLVALLLALTWLVPAAPVLADTDIEGLVSCGRPSGSRCDAQNVLQIRTDALGTPGQLLDVDVAWVKDRLGTLDQDDLVCLTVEKAPDDGWRAIGLIERCGTEGTVNAGLSTGTHKVQERGKRPKEDDVPRHDAPGTSISGTVTDSLSGAPVAGVQVAITTASGSTTTTTTNAGGQYSIGNLTPGTTTVSFTRTGYTSASRTVQVVQSQTTDVSVALVPNTSGSAIQIVLTWGSAPLDLDAHLSGPTPAGDRFHVNFASPNPVSYVSLDRDDKDSFGPETITIQTVTGTSQFVPGDYRFWVQNFSITPGFDVSNASVTVFQAGRQLALYPVSAASGDPRQGIWQVVTLTVDAAGTVTLTPVQQFQPGDETTTLTTKPASP